MTGEELKRQIALYESADHTVHLDVKVDEDTVWLNRQQLALLFGRDIKTIGKHVGNALREELNGFSVVAKFATTASDGKAYKTKYYNLDVIISVGYRVKSKRGVEFRKWATDSTTGTSGSPPVCFSTFLTGTGYFFVMVQRLSVMMCSLPPRS